MWDNEPPKEKMGTQGMKFENITRKIEVEKVMLRNVHGNEVYQKRKRLM